MPEETFHVDDEFGEDLVVLDISNRRILEDHQRANRLSLIPRHIAESILSKIKDYDEIRRLEAERDALRARMATLALERLKK